VLEFEPELVARIDREELLEHDSPEEVEIRACAVHAVELLVAGHGATEQTKGEGGSRIDKRPARRTLTGANRNDSQKFSPVAIR